MIVFLDTQKRIINIYTDNGKISYPFCEAASIKSVIGDNRPLYVTGAVIATSDEIINAIYSVVGNAAETNLNTQYLRSTMKGSLNISAIGLSFKNAADLKPLEDIYQKYGKDILKQPVMQDLLNSRKLQVVTHEDAGAIRRIQLEKEIQQQNKVDEGLDSILVDGGVDKHLDTYRESGAAGHDGAVQIDLEKGGRGRPNSGSGSSNEGSLLPDDFA